MTSPADHGANRRGCAFRVGYAVSPKNLAQPVRRVTFATSAPTIEVDGF